MIEDKRLFEIIDGNEPTDSEVAEIVRSANAHCRKIILGGGLIAFRQASQGSTWWQAFKAIFDGMKESEGK